MLSYDLSFLAFTENIHHIIGDLYNHSIHIDMFRNYVSSVFISGLQLVKTEFKVFDRFSNFEKVHMRAHIFLSAFDEFLHDFGHFL